MDKTVSFITLGHAPREDIMDELGRHLSPGIRIRQVGVLDPFTVEQVQTDFAASGNEPRLASRLSNGEMTQFAKAKVLPLLQKTVDAECDGGASLIVILCTNKLDKLRSPVPLIEPYDLLHGITAAVGRGCKLGALFPFEQFAGEMASNWRSEGLPVAYRCAHSDDACSEEAAAYFRQEGCTLLIQDCIGYTWACKDYYAGRLGIPVLHPRSLIADMIHNLLNIRPTEE